MSRKYKFKDNEKLDFIHKNPVKSGFVLGEEDWLYKYSGEKGNVSNYKAQVRHRT